MGETHPVAAVHRPSWPGWLRIRADIVRIENEQFGEGAFDEEYLAYEFTRPVNTVVLLRDAITGTVVGFTYAVPVGEIDPDRERESGETAYICDTVLDGAHQGMGLVARLMRVLENELRVRGYRFIERDAAVGNGYAAAIERAYGDRIVGQGEPHDSEYGPQTFFRIRL